MTGLPLGGVKVVDLTHALAGPFCTYHLAVMGAEVIKVEPPRGDEFRGHPQVFHTANAGKRSVVLDLKDARGRALLDRIVEGADVLVENFRPGAAARLGLTWEHLHKVNRRLIYCSISGYGQDGSMRDMPAVEFAVQAATGLMAAQLEESDHPRKTPMVLLDPLTGHLAYSAILAALVQRGASGEGQRIDVAMMDAAMMLMAPLVVDTQEAAPAAIGGRDGFIGRPTVGRFAARDGDIFIAAVQPAWWETVCRTIGREDMLADPRFATADARFDNAELLMAEWNAALAGKSAEEWETSLAEAGVPVGRVRSLADFMRHPHVAARGSLSPLTTPGRAEPTLIAGAGVRFEHGGPRVSSTLPALGADTTDVLRAIGCSDDEIAELTAAGVTMPRGGATEGMMRR